MNAVLHSVGKCKDRSCLSKRRYWSQVDALVMAERRMENGSLPRLGTYRCSNCRGWHLTRLAF